jgi:two-component SAPR family response regulator
MFELAIEENKKWGHLTNSPVKTKVTQAHLEAAAGHREEAEKIIEDIRTNHELMENDYRGMAIIYAALGEIDTAFEWLELSYQRREASLCSMKVDPKMEPLRKDPRFNEMLRKVGLLV